MVEDEQVHDALRALLDEPAPPHTTRLDDLVSRGRRRVVARRLGTALAVVAVVGGVTVGAAALRAGSASVPVAAGPAGARPSSSVSTPGVLPGWQVVRVPSIPWPTLNSPPPGAVDPGPQCEHTVKLPDPTGTILPQDVVQPAFTQAVTGIATGAEVTTVDAGWSQHDPKSGGPRGYVRLDITDSGGQGSTTLEVTRYGGTAAQAADADAYIYGDCAAPQRKVLPDGVILQLYAPMRFDPQQPVQYLRIYGPAGRMYIVDSDGFGSSNFQSIPGEPASTVVGGRGSLALTDSQLAAIGERIAQLP